PRPVVAPLLPGCPGHDRDEDGDVHPRQRRRDLGRVDEGSESEEPDDRGAYTVEQAFSARLLLCQQGGERWVWRRLGRDVAPFDGRTGWVGHDIARGSRGVCSRPTVAARGS